ncbi:MAG TPA: HD domain-containing phosphohydrolase [Gemmataceae bacterium]|nr:HD domain-containing phosphohydrolase [Gemmataceae bacterium]
MTETQSLLGKIAALRQRLEQAQKLASEANTAARDLFAPTVGVLERRTHDGEAQDAALDAAVYVLAPSIEPPPLPQQLTMRARRVLERGRDLLSRLRQISDAFASPLDESGPAVLFDRADPLTILYRETAAMTDTSLRLVPLFPQTATAQLYLCEGLEAILTVIAGRLKTLIAGVQTRRAENGRIAFLAQLLTELEAGRPVDAAPLMDLAEEIAGDAQDGGPLLFLEGDPARPAHFVACHGLTAARVIARVARDDPDWDSRLVEPVLAALLHDAGMLRVPADILKKTDLLTLEERRVIESHCRTGAEMAWRLWPDAAWLARAVVEHHERMDGTGYPDGLGAAQLSPLSRLLAVCDVYTAFCTARPYRPAKETRTALTDVLLTAEGGALDRDYAERLLHLSFYPVGSAVEMADGSLALVAASPSASPDDLNAPARPVVAVLTDADGESLPAPRHIDLIRREDQSIVRTLAAGERRELLATRFPEWA